MRKFLLSRVLPMVTFATVLPLTTTANAAAYLFNLSGPNSASFILDSSPTPAVAGSSYFTLQNVAGTYDGSPITLSNLTFFTTGASSGGFLASSGGATFLDLEGPQLFTGTTASPTFELGTFNLDDGGNGFYTLSVALAAVPEPASWVMMLVGFGGMGLTIRRRRALTPLASRLGRVG